MKPSAPVTNALEPSNFWVNDGLRHRGKCIGALPRRCSSSAALQVPRPSSLVLLPVSHRVCATAADLERPSAQKSDLRIGHAAFSDLNPLHCPWHPK